MLVVLAHSPFASFASHNVIPVKQAMLLKEAKLLNKKLHSDGSMGSLYVIDLIQRLGICQYHNFREEIEAALQSQHLILSNYPIDFLRSHELQEATLAHRLLRQGGHYFNKDLFGSLLCDRSNFKEKYYDNAKSLTILYAAPQLSIDREDGVNNVGYLCREFLQAWVLIHQDYIAAIYIANTLQYPVHYGLLGFMDKSIFLVDLKAKNEWTCLVELANNFLMLNYGDEFLINDFPLLNTRGPDALQAMAFKIDSDLCVKTRVRINDFCRIGRLVLRDDIVVAINDPFIDANYMAYKFKYDSTLGPFKGSIKILDDFEAFYVIVSSRDFPTIEKATSHLKGGAKKAIISTPFADAPMFVVGVNVKPYMSNMEFVTNASCPRNCLAPLVQVVHVESGVVYANYVVDNCDLLLVFGVRVDDLVTGLLEIFANKAKIVMFGRGFALFGSYAKSSCAAIVVASIFPFEIIHEFTATLCLLCISYVGILVYLITTLVTS